MRFLILTRMGVTGTPQRQSRCDSDLAPLPPDDEIEDAAAGSSRSETMVLLCWGHTVGKSR